MTLGEEELFDKDYKWNIEHWKVKDERRKAIYNKIKSTLPSNSLAYYPASGSDPIPGQVFTDHIVYGSLELRYFDMLAGPQSGLPSRYRAYSGFTDQNKPEYILADGTKNPFSDSKFDLVILNTLGLFDNGHEELLTQEIARILKPGGVFVLEVEGMEPQDEVKYIYHSDPYRKILLAIKATGFRPHPIQKEVTTISKDVLRQTSIEKYQPLKGENWWEEDEIFSYFFEDHNIKIFRNKVK